MTSMIHKSPDSRRTRRNRYIEAIEPFRKKYNCPAKAVFGIIQGIEGDNARLQRKIDDLQNGLKEAGDKADKLEQEKKDLQAQFNPLMAERNDLRAELDVLREAAKSPASGQEGGAS